MAQETATLVAAVIAALAGICAALLSAMSAHRSRRQTENLERAADARHRELAGREQWWIRFSWALERALSTDPRDVRVGLIILRALLDAPWVRPDDSELALAVVDTIAGNAGGGADSE